MSAYPAKSAFLLVKKDTRSTKRALPFTQVRNSRPPSLPEIPLSERGNETNLNRETNYGFSGSKNYPRVMKQYRHLKTRKESAPMKRGETIDEGIRWEE